MVERISESQRQRMVGEIAKAANTLEETWSSLWAVEALRDDFRTSYLPKFMDPCILLGRSVLDVGSGISSDVLRMSGSASYVGLDLSRTALTASMISNPELKLAQGDAAALPFKDNSFDLVVAIDVITYLGRNGFNALAEMARVSNNRILFSIPVAEDGSHGVFYSPDYKIEIGITNRTALAAALKMLDVTLLDAVPHVDMLLIDATKRK